MNLINDQYLCNFCNIPCPESFSHNLNVDFYKCASCNSIFEIHCDEKLHKIIFNRKLKNKDYQLIINLDDNQTSLYLKNGKTNKIIFEINEIINITLQNIIQKLKLYILIS